MSFEKPVPLRDRFDYNLPQRRIAHISSIQIRNLTPFPARDTLTSALSKPTEFSNLTNGHVADDLDTIPTRKRTRRISTASVVTVRTSRSEDAEFNGVPDVHEGRKRASSRFSEKEKEKSATVGRSAPTLRPQRNRTTSLASIFTPPTHLPEASNLEPPYKTPSLLEDDYSQTGLENIISSRLVQTFLAVTALPEPYPVQDDASASSSFSPPASPPNGFPVLGPRKDVSSPSPFSKSRRDSWTSTRSSSHSPPAMSIGHSRSLSTAAIPRKGLVKPTAGSPLASSSASASTSTSSPNPSVPNYLSSIHQPSTNPRFFFNPKSEFAPWTDFSATTLEVGLWAKVRNNSGVANANGKGKERESSHENKDSEASFVWQRLEAWNVDLNSLSPLPREDPEDTFTKQDFCHRLPSNTLLITLNPPGRTFYVHPPSLSPSSPEKGSSSSATQGYSSDPESTIRKDLEHETMDSEPAAAFPSRRRRARGRHGHGQEPDEEYLANTAGWKDLFKLVTTWTTIKDNESSLEDIVRGLDHLIADDIVLPLKREISERESRIAELRADCAGVSTKTQEHGEGGLRPSLLTHKGFPPVRDEILIRREQLRERRRMLAYVEQQEDDEGQRGREDVEDEILDERTLLSSLHHRLLRTRTSLISTLAYLFPIDLRSSAELLFTILDVPLPIPASPTDPAPPLSSLNHPEVNEESVATALGYVALLVHLLSAYLGHVLVYPITFIGSRSMIRDGISAMVGPRMFPLFSKGVDTYRFEYAVFLLNKDIELLMVEHNLRAIDIRHTLPNLKNILLTLTVSDGEDVRLPITNGPQRFRESSSPITSLASLSLTTLESPRSHSPSSPSSPSSPREQELADSTTTNSNMTTPKASHIHLPAPESTVTPPTSGSTTPTTPSGPTNIANVANVSNVSMDTLKKTSRFLGNLTVTPFADFLNLRVRYPSSLGSRGVDEAQLHGQVAQVGHADPESGEVDAEVSGSHSSHSSHSNTKVADYVGSGSEGTPGGEVERELTLRDDSFAVPPRGYHGSHSDLVECSSEAENSRAMQEQMSFMTCDRWWLRILWMLMTRAHSTASSPQDGHRADPESGEVDADAIIMGQVEVEVSGNHSHSKVADYVDSEGTPELKGRLGSLIFLAAGALREVQTSNFKSLAELVDWSHSGSRRKFKSNVANVVHGSSMTVVCRFSMRPSCH
ncbi:UV radiation resistance protein and autophagy-related subunit 14-domain-containing protein [Lentinula raphanica]|nr:UV radiation resistance protein and autophagy-related subunit 14-domain-containing protein [Lentinula raphanica]